MTSTYKVTYYKPNLAGSRSMKVEAEYHSEAEDLVRGMVPGADVIRSEEVRGGSSSSGGDMNFGDMGGMLGLFAVLFVLWLIIEYWMWILPITLIGAILYYFGTKEN